MTLHITRAAIRLLVLAPLLLGLSLIAQVNYGIDYSRYSIIVNNYASLSANTHVHRGVLIGDTLNVAGSGTSFNMDLSAAEKTYNSVTNKLPNFYVGGSLTTSAASADPDMMTGSYQYGSKSAAITLKNPGTQVPGDFFSGKFSAEFGEFQQEASRLDKLANNASWAIIDGNKGLQFTASANAVSVVDITVAQLQGFFNGSNEYFTFSGITAQNKLVINVLGNGGAFTFNPEAGFLGLSNLTLTSNIVWNFRYVSTLTLNTSGRAFWGTILAPDSQVVWQGNGDVEGQMIAYNLVDTSNHQYHDNGYFTTELPPIPEPSTYALLGAASCGALALLRRRRRAA